MLPTAPTDSTATEDRPPFSPVVGGSGLRITHPLVEAGEIRTRDVGARKILDLSAQAGEEVVFGQGRAGGVVDADECLDTHDLSEPLLAHPQEKDVLALTGMSLE